MLKLISQFFGVPFLAEAGLTSGVEGFLGVAFELARFAEDGITLCPENNALVYLDMGHIWVYMERLYGGVYVEAPAYGEPFHINGVLALNV